MGFRIKMLSEFYFPFKSLDPYLSKWNSWVFSGIPFSRNPEYDLINMFQKKYTIRALIFSQGLFLILIGIKFMSSESLFSAWFCIQHHKHVLESSYCCDFYKDFRGNKSGIIDGPWISFV